MTKLFSAFAWLVVLLGLSAFVCFGSVAVRGVFINRPDFFVNGGIGAAIGAVLVLVASVQLMLASATRVRLAAA